MTELLKELEAVVLLADKVQQCSSQENIAAFTKSAAKTMYLHHAEIAEALKTKVCEWTQDEWDGSWDTVCGNKHQFIDGSPRDNEHTFCPYCGGTLETVDVAIDAMHNSAREVGE